MRDEENINELAYKIMEIVEPHGPKDALDIMTVAVSSVIICSVNTQLDAINVIKEVVEAVMHTIDGYKNHPHCHWEHED